MASKVFIPERPQNGSLERFKEAAKKYGELVVVVRREDSPPGVFTDKFVAYLLQRLKDEDFDPQRDYILIAGRSIQLALLVALISSKDTVQLLGYNASTEEYIPLQV